MPHVLGDDFDRCCAPLAGEEPTGQDARYAETFVDLKGEIENIASGSVDWKRVRTLALDVLTGASKDLNAMGYLTAALVQLEGFRGLADGLAILRHWMEKDWEKLYPRTNPRSRGFALGWLAERVTPYIEQREPEGDEVQLLTPLIDDVAAIQGISDKELKHFAPSFGELRQILTRKAAAHAPALAAEPGHDATPEPPATSPAPAAAQPAPAAAQPAPGQASAATAPTPAPASAPAPAAAPAQPQPAAAKPEAARPVALPAAPPLPSNATANEVRNRIRSLIGPWRQSEVMNPAPYRLLRILKWEDLQGPPPADPGSGKTKVPGPRMQQREALKALSQAGRWLELLEASEAAFQDGSGTFWLDLQRYSVSALEGIDPAVGARLAEMLKEELRRLLERFPDLPRLTFADSAPFASPETQQWLDETVRKVKIALVSAGGREEDTALTAEEAEEVKELFARRQIDGAMELLQGAVRRANGPRAAFRTRLTAAQLCLTAGRVPWARKVLEQLRRETEELRFEQWEPELSVELYQLLGLCLGRQIEHAAGAEQLALQEALDDVHARLFALDLRAAARVEESLGELSGQKGGQGRQSTDILQLMKQLLKRV